MLGKYPRELAAEYVLNEGGIGLTGPVVPGQVLFAVSAAEKGTADIHLIARGKPGHGSTPRPDQAPDRLRDALAHLSTMESPLVFHAYAWELFRRVGATQGGLTGWIMRHPSVSSGILLRELRKAPSSRASVSNTINLTMVRAGDKVNVVPGVAEAWLDCRLLPGTTPEAMRDRIARELAAYQVEVRLDAGEPATTSPWTTDLFRALEHHLVDGAPGAVVAPILSPGFTDSKYFRDRGAVAYGIVPFVVSDDEFEGIHGHNERVEVSELGLGVRRIYRTLVEVARK
jgi:acetylornithine deacetylase/succinyl-diaminopimelate desuccinylase-like protein